MRTLTLAIAVLLLSRSLAAQPVAESVVYSQERDGNHDLYLASSDGTNVRRLTTDPLPDETPRCSPDGRFVAFVRGGFQGGDLIRLNLETGEEHRLTNDTIRDSTPTWSTDGTRIYFTRRVGKFDRLAVMSADGTDVQYLTDGERWHDTMPAIAPDGRTLVHHTYRYGQGTELQLLDLLTRSTRRLTTFPGFDYEAFFADRDTVMFSSNRDGGHYRIYVTSIADGSTRMLADTGADAWNSRYSPHSGRVLFHSGAPGKWRLHTTTLSGEGGVQPFLNDGTSKASGDWCIAPPVRRPGRSDDDLGVTAARREMVKLSAMVGEFELSSRETGTDGSSFRESGWRSCRWAFGETAIHCEDERTLREAVGRYAQLPAHRRSMRLFRWNVPNKHFEQVDIGVAGRPDARELRFDAALSTLSYDSVVESVSMTLTLDNASTLRFSTGGHELVQNLRSRTSSFSEEYRETATRLRP